MPFAMRSRSGTTDGANADSATTRTATRGGSPYGGQSTQGGSMDQKSERVIPPCALAPPGRDVRAPFRPRWSPRAEPPVDGRVRQGRKRNPGCADALLAAARGQHHQGGALEPGIRPNCRRASGSQRQMLEGGFGDNPAAGSRNFHAHSGPLCRPFKPRTAFLRRPDRARSRSTEHPSTHGTPRVGAPQKNFSPAAFGVGSRPERTCFRKGAPPVDGASERPPQKAS